MPTLAPMDILATGLLRGTTSVLETIPLAVTPRMLAIGEPNIVFLIGNFISLKIIYVMSCFVYLLYTSMYLSFLFVSFYSPLRLPWLHIGRYKLILAWILIVMLIVALLLTIARSGGRTRSAPFR
jgi:hypothetical protein